MRCTTTSSASRSSSGEGAAADEDVVGVDAALDFPLFFVLPGVAKAQVAPRALVDMYQTRKRVERNVVSSHGEASRYFVTFLDNHDQRSRFRFNSAQFDPQTTLGLACLLTLPGIPCLYYGTEQGLSGVGNADLAVREALWGAPAPFDQASPFYLTIQQLATLRLQSRLSGYGRLYFRQLSGDGVHFGISDFRGGVLAFSRILHKREIVVVANCSTSSTFSGQVIVDAPFTPRRRAWRSCSRTWPEPQACAVSTSGPADIEEGDGSRSSGRRASFSVSLAPMDVVILGFPLTSGDAQ